MTGTSRTARRSPRPSPRPSPLRRPILWAPLLVTVLLAAWWFAWMKPEGAKLATARFERASDEAMVASLQAKIAHLHAVAAREQKAKGFLKTFAGQIPATPEAPQLVVQIYRLASRDHLKLASITDNAVDPAGAGYSTIPVTLAVSGSQAGITAFVTGLYHLPRLVTIQQLDLTGPAKGDVVVGVGGGYQATISATAYTTSVTATSTAGVGSTG